MEEKHTRNDRSIAIIVIIAGLLTGAVLTYVFLQPEEQSQPRYSPEFRVAEGQRVPLESTDGLGWDSAGAPVAPAPGDEDPVSVGDTPEGGGDRVRLREESTASERKTMEETRERIKARGVEDYAELTEELYIRVSAKMVVMASVLSQSADEDVDPADVQGLLADNAAEVLADARVDPEDFWVFTRDIHSDPARAKEMGEKILREAEKHTEQKIRFEDVPGMSPTPVPGVDSNAGGH